MKNLRSKFLGLWIVAIVAFFAAPTNVTADASYWVSNFGVDDGWTTDKNPRMMADVNGDGLQDVVGFANAGVYVALSTGSGFEAATYWVSNFGVDNGWTIDKHPRMMADVNGDGKQDVVGFANAGVYVALSTGSGFEAATYWVSNFGVNDGWTDKNPRMMADLNGDGKQDVVGFANAGVYVALSTGTGFEAGSYWVSNFGVDDGWTVDKHPRMMADVNGDGKQDVVGFANAGVYVALSTLKTPHDLVSIQLSPASTFVEVDESEQFTATAIFLDDTTEDVTSTATWNISDASIAVVNQTGTATGVSVGSVTLAATYSANGVEKTGVANLDVLSAPPVFISLTIEGNDVVSIGLTEHLTAIATLSDDSNYTVNDKVDWISSDDAIATVDAMGVVTGVTLGDVTITATAKSDNSIVATHDMTVTEATLVSIQIEDGYNPDTPQPITTLEVPITTEHYITAWGIYSDGSRHYINPDVVWWSSDQQIASINFIVSSKVYGRDLGTAMITAYYEELEAAITVNVVLADGAPTLTAITLKTDDGTDVTDGTIDPIPAGFKTWVTAYGTYSDGTTSNINRYVSYSSDKPEVAYVLDALDSNIRGLSEGSAVITAEWQGVSAPVTAPVLGLTSIIIKTGENAETPPPGSVIDIDNPLTMETGLFNRVYITAHGMYTDSVERYINAEVFWLSDDNDIASMSLLQLNSWVTGKSAGTTQVSAKLVGVEGRATVIVE